MYKERKILWSSLNQVSFTDIKLELYLGLQGVVIPDPRGGRHSDARDYLRRLAVAWCNDSELLQTFENIFKTQPVNVFGLVADVHEIIKKPCIWLISLFF